MLNKEKYAKEILQIATRGSSVAKVDGKLYSCDNTDCALCDFSRETMFEDGCEKTICEWMNEEYKSVSNDIKDILIPGTHFTFKNYEWIVLDNNVDGGVLAVMASTWNDEKYSFDDDGCNNYAKSSLRRKLLNELFPVLGEDNLISHEVDLVADNGDDRYGTVTDRVFILSCDEYRKYHKHVPLLPEWMWTCTPWYIADTGNSYNVRFVSTDGILNGGNAHGSYGVAPACVFNLQKLNLISSIELTEKSITGE